jgi:hypothetical protein
MKALTVLQPWASLLVFGEKRFETRSWQTAHRGRIAIHAGLRRTDSARDLCTIEPFRSALARHGIKHFTDLPKGVIIGTIDLMDCMPVEAAAKYMRAGPTPEHGGFNTAQEQAFGDIRPGRWAWQLCNPSPLAVSAVADAPSLSLMLTVIG